MSDRLKDLVRGAGSSDSPFDRTGLLCLAWTAVFIALTAVLSLTLR